jgi:hypothetical protein
MNDRQSIKNQLNHLEDLSNKDLSLKETFDAFGDVFLLKKDIYKIKDNDLRDKNNALQDKLSSQIKDKLFYYTKNPSRTVDTFRNSSMVSNKTNDNEDDFLYLDDLLTYDDFFDD